MIHTYADGKKLTLSENTFPARIVVSEISSMYTLEKLLSMLNDKVLDLQHVSGPSHQEFLQVIVEADHDRLREKLKNDILALSIRCDGSVDRSQVHKIFTMAKIITKTG